MKYNKTRLGVSLSIVGALSYFISSNVESGDPMRVKLEVSGVIMLGAGIALIGLSK